MKKNLGLLGGSFDPVHLGHLRLAEGVLEEKNLDQIYFCPAWISPHKQTTPPESAAHRVAMLKLAIEGHFPFTILTDEIERQGVSYMVDTLTELSKHYEGQWHLIIGSDTLQGFLSWKESDKILELAELIVVPRDREQTIPTVDDPLLQVAVRKGWTPLSITDVSSTEVRRQIAANEDCRSLVPLKVLDYIYDNKLYSS